MFALELYLGINSWEVFKKSKLNSFVRFDFNSNYGN